jgi:hypothetical protein
MSEYMPEERLSDLEAALAALRPLPAQLDRDRLMFRAGRRSQPLRWLWPAATALMTAATIMLAVVLVTRPAPQRVERIVHVPIKEMVSPPDPNPEVPPTPPEPEVFTSTEAEPGAGATNYYSQQRQVMRWGLDGLRQPPAPSPELPLKLDSLLGKSSSH